VGKDYLSLVYSYGFWTLFSHYWALRLYLVLLILYCFEVIFGALDLILFLWLWNSFEIYLSEMNKKALYFQKKKKKKKPL
jgi:hypothetical protein